MCNYIDKCISSTKILEAKKKTNYENMYAE